MFDPKSKRRAYLAQLDVDKYCARYAQECKELGTHQITPEEQEQFEVKLAKGMPSSYLANRLYSLYTKEGESLHENTHKDAEYSSSVPQLHQQRAEEDCSLR